MDNFSRTQIVRKAVIPTRGGVVAAAHCRAAEVGAAVLEDGGDAYNPFLESGDGVPADVEDAGPALVAQPVAAPAEEGEFNPFLEDAKTSGSETADDE